MAELINKKAFIEDIKTEIVNLGMDGLKGTPRDRSYLYEMIDRINEQPTTTEAELRASVIDEFAERVKMASIRGTFEHKPDKEKPWYKVRSYCKVVGTRKIDEIASQMKGEKE